MSTKRLQNEGVKLTSLLEDKPWGWRHAYTRDPVGRTVEIALRCQTLASTIRQKPSECDVHLWTRFIGPDLLCSRASENQSQLDEGPGFPICSAGQLFRWQFPASRD
jgi:hypothetical protein